MFDIKAIRDSIEQQYIGFSPNTTNVKPAHLANGMFRVLLGQRFDTNRLFRFIYPTLSDGSPVPGNELATIYDQLVASDHLDTKEVSTEQIALLRTALRKIVSADKSVYVGKVPKRASQAIDRMDSYSAGSAGFVSNDRIAQDGGEFLALWLQKDAPEFTTVLRAALNQQNDPITVIAKPLLDEEIGSTVTIDGAETIIGLNDTCPPSLRQGMIRLALSAKRLEQHLSAHPNKLTRLRMGMLLGSFLIVRYLADLESMYTPTASRGRPIFLLDFSTTDNGPIRAASQRSYVYACQAVTRFYSWMFAQYLQDQFTIDDLALAPTYGKMKPEDQKIIADVWPAALEDLQDTTEPYRVLGQAVYDILALLAEATPVQYLRQIGIRCGLFWPPYNLQPTKHMAPRQDLLEVLILSVAQQGDLLTLHELQDRLWETYGIIIGGRTDDLDLLVNAGIYQADSQALEQNQSAFVGQLRDLSFARLLADGVLEVQVGTAWN